MAQAFNFETRELTPYTDNWNRGGNVKISGALWYIPKLDGLYIVDNPNAHPGSTHINEYCVSRGLPAAILAQGDALVNPNFDYKACYQAYFKKAKELFPTKPTHDVRTVLEDWVYTLNQSAPIDRKISGYIDNYGMMAVACYLRDSANPYNKFKSLVDQINNSYYYICNFDSKNKPQLIISRMPSVADRTEAPLIYANDFDQPMDKAVLQADGFMAAVINLAMLCYWRRRWSGYNFTNIEVVENVLNTYHIQKPIEDRITLQHLSFDLPIEVEEIFRAYMEAFMPVMQKVWKLNPAVQLECIEGDNIYTYIYVHELSSPERLLNSELYANLSDHQKETLKLYGKRFLQWLPKNYPITSASHHRVMQAMGMDLPPIQLQITNNTQIIRKKEYCKKLSTFLVPQSDPCMDDDDVQMHLEEAANGGATDLANYLSSEEGKRHFNFRNMSRPQVLAILNEECGTEIKDDTFYRACMKCNLKFPNIAMREPY